MTSPIREPVRLEIKNLTKKYGKDVRAIDNLSMNAQPGELVSFLGPSGCGKTTTLNCVAGLEFPDEGRITAGDFVLTDTARNILLQPEERKLGMVFQSYALWPHMRVSENVAFGLRVAGVPAEERKRRTGNILERVGLAHLAERYPFQLSGGQQQRVALARAVVTEPRLLLLDEPLSNLDAKVREQARIWLREMQRGLGITTVYVTHDQAEALAMSDKIAIISNGQLQQFGSPQEVYDNPANRFVAEFIGASSVVQGTLVDVANGAATLKLANGSQVKAARLPAKMPQLGQEVSMVLRSERARLATQESTNLLEGRVISADYLGSKWHLSIKTGAGEIKIESMERWDGPIRLYLPPEALIVLGE